MVKQQRSEAMMDESDEIISISVNEDGMSMNVDDPTFMEMTALVAFLAVVCLAIWLKWGRKR